MGLWITQVDCILASRLWSISDLVSGIDPIFEKDTEFDADRHNHSLTKLIGGFFSEFKFICVLWKRVLKDDVFIHNVFLYKFEVRVVRVINEVKCLMKCLKKMLCPGLVWFVGVFLLKRLFLYFSKSSKRLRIGLEQIRLVSYNGTCVI